MPSAYRSWHLRASTLQVTPFYPRDVVSAVYATATWLAGWVSVTRRYYIKTAKRILKLFRLSVW